MRDARFLPLSLATMLLLSAIGVSPCRASAVELPENLATKARVSASSQFNGSYCPQMAVAGAVPDGAQREGGEWAVRGTQKAWFELQWDQPVDAAQIVYCARVTSPLLECFKDYAVYLNG